MSPLTNNTQASNKKNLVYYQSSISQSKLLFICLTLLVSNIQPSTAHKVQAAADVGGTLHIEPNDTPRSGEVSQAWFALTRKGGKVLPLAQCNCQLAVYAEPHTEGEPALIEPSLKPVNAERYQGIPGADITFPKPGIYQLQLIGKPKNGANFQPFVLKFDVTVAAGKSINSPTIPDSKNEEQVVLNQFKEIIPSWAIAIPIVAVLGIFLVVLRSKQGSGK